MSKQTRYVPCTGCGKPRPQGGHVSKPGSVCRRCRENQKRSSGTVPCPMCGAPRRRYGCMKPDSVCRQCRSKKYGRATWLHAQDTLAAKSERAKRWKEPTERPELTGLKLGTPTKWGPIQSRGQNQQGRYYEFLRDGVALRVSAEEVEAA